MVLCGCDILLEGSCRRLEGRRIALLANPASVTRGLDPLSARLASCGVRLACLFGPQHGLRGDTQANMIEWEGYRHPTLGVPVYSLYGERREPSPGMLADVDTIVIDLPDVGARPYTYLWTALLMVRAAAAAGKDAIVLDRPNPLGGEAIEGPILEAGFESFVGLFPLAMRHGLTIGEALAFAAGAGRPGSAIEIVPMRGWRRSMLFDETGLPWVLPSPNMPTPDTALVYPGTVLLEGTNISEGRGTTRPFETIGAPWIDPEGFAAELSAAGIPGAVFRPVHFAPTFDKYSGELCGGVQIHVTDRRAFRPVRCGAAAIAAAARLRPERFRWLDPPYEYERRLPPIDIISGSAELRETIDRGGPLEPLFESWTTDEDRFRDARKPFLLY